jgi:uncharacterized protein with von Willebrand factor type A (vWA) domain
MALDLKDIDLPGSIVQALVLFSQHLRQEGFNLTHVHVADSLRSLMELDLNSRAQVKKAIAANMVSSHEEAVIFSVLFDTFFQVAPQPVIAADTAPIPSCLKSETMSTELLEEADGPDGEKDVVGAGLEKVRAHIDFDRLEPDETGEIVKRIQRLARRLALRLSRRHRRIDKVCRLDFRLTMRRSLSLGGEPLKPLFKTRRENRMNIYCLVDISGSMAVYGYFFLLFLHALQKVWPATHSFVFSTHLSPVRSRLASQGFGDAIKKILQPEVNWKGGTDIGSSLMQFYRDHLRARSATRAVVIVVSDGWNRGAPEEMSAAMRLVGGHCRKLIWLNPLMSSPRYEPICQGMRQALPYIDMLMPFYNLDSLDHFCRKLEGTVRPHPGVSPVEKRNLKTGH